MMFPPVQEILEGMNIRSVGARIFQTSAPEDQTKSSGIQLDYIVWTIISNIPNINLSDLPDDDQQNIQIDVYSASQPNSSGIAKRVRDTIEPIAHITRGPEPMYEPDTKLFHWSMDATFFTNRN